MRGWVWHFKIQGWEDVVSVQCKKVRFMGLRRWWDREGVGQVLCSWMKGHC